MQVTAADAFGLPIDDPALAAAVTDGMERVEKQARAGGRPRRRVHRGRCPAPPGGRRQAVPTAADRAVGAGWAPSRAR
nr:hypothetical protein [Angustibacter aerolatus]